MDQEFVNNKTTKDLAQISTIPAIELPPLNIITKLSSEDMEYLENEVIPFAILKNISNQFIDFSEEWTEFFNSEIKKETSKSSKIGFRFFHLQGQSFNFKNKLISNKYQSKENYEVLVNEARREVILTDGEVVKNEKKIIKSADDLFSETYQDLQVFNLSYLIVLDREKKTNPFGRWEHHDVISIYMSDRIKLDYLRMYIGSTR